MYKLPQMLIYVETDPSGRYGRFKEILGKGSTKTVYKAFDKVLGMEVAWNQVSLNNVLRSPEELQRLYSEVHLLNNLNHQSIIKFHTSWIDIDRGNFNFITEMFTSGTLRQYIKKYPRVNIRAVKNWARQILGGLAYLHQHDPPVIHRDLKCDNIFVNGHLGQVKIGDLGLAAILRGSQHAHSVIGTPEFMAPELYEEEYNELVDVYSFGMCVLEMLTSEYPYCECSNPAQIYKKVTSGKLPEAFYRIKDAEAQKFIGKCLEKASKRLPAKELLLDPFLASDEPETLAIPIVPFQRSTLFDQAIKDENASSFQATSTRATDVTITGTMNPEGDTIFLKVKISDKDGQTRNIYFPFDINNDTPIDVAMEMVKELEIVDLEPMEIAEIIEEEITNLLPSWKDWDQLSQANNNPHQHSFNYIDEGLVEENDDDENDEIHHPFHCASSYSSSQASLQAFISSNLPRPSHSAISVHNWLQGELFINDDTSSQSSTNSYKYSTPIYRDGYANTGDLGIEEADVLSFKRTNHKSTRFCPEGKLYEKEKQFKQRNQFYNWDSKWGCGISNPQGKLSRIKSMVNVRSQLLHKSLVEEINRRRLFSTVGAVENIGYHEPNLPTNNDQKPRSKW